MLNLNDVALFVEVAHAGSFAEAARSLRVPPATVGRRIQQLEAHLGARLIQRSTRKLTLTSAGLAFYEQCSPAIRELVETGQQQAINGEEPRGLVRVAAPACFFKLFKMEWIESFLEKHPLVKLEFVLSDALVDLIAERIDVALRGGPLQDSSYIARKIFTDYGGLFASPAYLAARGIPTDLRALRHHECVTAQSESCSHVTWRLQGPDGSEDEIRVGGRFAGNSIDVLREAACSGLGIAALPFAMAASDVESRKLTPVLPQYRLACCSFSAIYASRRQIPPAVTVFVDMVAEKLRLHEIAFNSGGSTV